MIISLKRTKKRIRTFKIILLQTFHLLIVSQFVRKKNILFQSYQSSKRMERLQNINKTNDS